VIGSLITFKPTDSDTLIIEPYYGNEANASLTSGSQNARWNALLAYYTHDFNDQTQPNAFSLRVRGEIFEDAGGARTCAGGVNVNGGTNTCFGSPASVGPVTNNNVFSFTPVSGQFPNGQAQTLWETTWTIQYKPAPSLMTRMEYRYDHSNKNVFINGDRASNNQSTLGFSVVYLF
jgi:hypothetical protein